MNKTQIEYCYECLHSRNKFTPHRKGYRICTYCKGEKKYSEFYGDNKSKHGVGYICKNCSPKISKKYNVYDPVRTRTNTLKRNFGITLDDYDRMLKSQNNKCAICNSTSTGRKGTKYFAVDHCHTTKKVRGLLCTRCNAGIGYMKDDVEILEKAIAYLGEMNNEV